MRVAPLITTLFFLSACGHSGSSKAMEVDANVQKIEAIFNTNAALRSVCERSDIEGLKYYLFRDAGVRQAFVARDVKVTRPGKGVQSIDRNHYVMPAFGIHQGREMITGGPEPWAWLKIDIKALPDGAFQLEWIRAKYELSGATAMPSRLEHTYGPLGRLIFVRTSQCWEVREDSVDDPQ
jgi:hypothetical protein